MMDTWRGVRIVYEDNHLLVVVKPPNMPTQADQSGDEDLQNAMKSYLANRYQKPGAVYLGLVHRLDRPVGGLVVLARTSKAAERLSSQVRQKTLSRVYLTVVRGCTPEHAELRDYLLKDERTNTVKTVEPDTPGGKEAILAYDRISAQGIFSLLKVKLFTGRSHQIRVQLSHAGFPIWGDARYGQGKPGEQIALWGAYMGLVHPTLKNEMHFEALPPAADPWSRFRMD